MTREPKRGRTNGRRRSVVSISLDGLSMLDLDRLVERFTLYRGVKQTRSNVVRRLIRMAAAVERGEDVRDMRRF